MINKQKVLIIDDSPLTVKILKDMLQQEYDIISSFNGEDGYKMAVAQSPDLIISDVLMSPIDGYDICRLLKQNPLTQNIPVIFISALDEMENEKKGLEIGAIDYITKPFSEPIVKIRVKNHLELKKNRDLLSELSSIDGLTGVYNKRYFEKLIKQLWDKAKIHKICLSVLMLDIDNFKIYNDNYGHLEGDECLRLVAKCIKGCLNNPNYSVARFGGEEFTCILYDTCNDEALTVAQKILTALNELNIPFEHSPISDRVTMSIGLKTVIPNEKVIITNFLKEADDLLYLAKKSGRNQIKYK